MLWGELGGGGEGRHDKGFRGWGELVFWGASGCLFVHFLFFSGFSEFSNLYKHPISGGTAVEEVQVAIETCPVHSLGKGKRGGLGLPQGLGLGGGGARRG